MKYTLFFVCVAIASLISVTPAQARTNTTTASTTPISTSTVHDAGAVEARVRAVFADAPAMVEIARCESKFRQFTDAGNPLRGGSGGGMIGVFQFFESIHQTPAKALGFDLATLEGNLGYARHVYDTQSTTPWNAARSCWETAASRVGTSTTIASPVTTTSSVAELQKQIAILRQLITLLETLKSLKA